MTEEHIIPEGMGGTLTVKNAVCFSCQTNINHYEARLQKVLLFDARRVMNLRKKKRKREGATHREFITQIDGKDVRINFLADKSPAFLILPMYFFPALMSFDVPKIFGPCGTWLHSFTSTNDPSLAGLTNVHTPPLDYLAFTQMLAKIAHSYCAAVHGIVWEDRRGRIAGYYCLLNSMITHILKREEIADEYFDYVGGYLNEKAISAAPALHQLGFVELSFGSIKYLAVQIRLFANLATPFYMVLVGRNTP